MLKNSSVKRNISTSLMKGCNMKKTYSVAMMGVAASLLLTHGAYGSILEIGHLRHKVAASDFAGLFLPDAIPYL